MQNIFRKFVEDGVGRKMARNWLCRHICKKLDFLENYNKPLLFQFLIWLTQSNANEPIPLESVSLYFPSASLIIFWELEYVGPFF